MTQAVDLLSGMPLTTVLQESLTPTLFNASGPAPRLQVLDSCGCISCVMNVLSKLLIPWQSVCIA